MGDFGLQRVLHDAATAKAAREAEREQCCKDVCPWCEDGDEPKRIGEDDGPWPWYHEMMYGAEHEVCVAWTIRERAAKGEKT